MKKLLYNIAFFCYTVSENTFARCTTSNRKLGFIGEKSKHQYEAPSGRGLPRSGWGRGRHKRIRFVLFRKMIKQDFFVRFLTHAPSVCLRQPPPSRREAWVRRDPNPPTNPNLKTPPAGLRGRLCYITASLRDWLYNRRVWHRHPRSSGVPPFCCIPSHRRRNRVHRHHIARQAD